MVGLSKRWSLVSRFAGPASLAAQALLGCNAAVDGTAEARDRAGVTRARLDASTAHGPSAPAHETASTATATAAAASAPAESSQASRCPEGMALVAAGTLIVGLKRGLEGMPPVRVPVQSFCLDRTEVTAQAYAACTDARKCTPAGTGENCNAGRTDRADHPINCVTSDQAAAFCAAAGDRIRLPTADEHDFATRGPEGRDYPWGDDIPTRQLCWRGPNSDRELHGWHFTCPVGSYPAGNTPEGLSDLVGNVWEWTSTRYCPNGPDVECKIDKRITSGSGWRNGKVPYMRGDIRLPRDPGYSVDHVGFRCARDDR